MVYTRYRDIHWSNTRQLKVLISEDISIYISPNRKISLSDKKFLKQFQCLQKDVSTFTILGCSSIWSTTNWLAFMMTSTICTASKTHSAGDDTYSNFSYSHTAIGGVTLIGRKRRTPNKTSSTIGTITF